MATPTGSRKLAPGKRVCERHPGLTRNKIFTSPPLRGEGGAQRRVRGRIEVRMIHRSRNQISVPIAMSPFLKLAGNTMTTEHLRSLRSKCSIASTCVTMQEPSGFRNSIGSPRLTVISLSKASKMPGRSIGARPSISRTSSTFKSRVITYAFNSFLSAASAQSADALPWCLRVSVVHSRSPSLCAAPLQIQLRLHQLRPELIPFFVHMQPVRCEHLLTRLAVRSQHCAVTVNEHQPVALHRRNLPVR